jgi:hypothetical protein
MILSHRHRLIFVKGRKVAGTSIEMLLARVCGPEDVVTPILRIDERERISMGAGPRNYSADPQLEAAYLRLVAEAPARELRRLRAPRGPWFNHMPLRGVLALCPAAAGYRVVAAERSPYAKLISFLNMEQTMRSYRRGGAMRGDPERFAQDFDSLDADGRLGAVCNIDLYRATDGALGVELLRYETLQSDMDALLASLGEAPAPLPYAKRGLMSDASDALALLRPDQIERINQVYAEEFDAFGYPRLG